LFLRFHFWEFNPKKDENQDYGKKIPINFQADDIISQKDLAFLIKRIQPFAANFRNT